VSYPLPRSYFLVLKIFFLESTFFRPGFCLLTNWFVGADTRVTAALTRIKSEPDPKRPWVCPISVAEFGSEPLFFAFYLHKPKIQRQKGKAYETVVLKQGAAKYRLKFEYANLSVCVLAVRVRPCLCCCSLNPLCCVVCYVVLVFP